MVVWPITQRDPFQKDNATLLMTLALAGALHLSICGYQMFSYARSQNRKSAQHVREASGSFQLMWPDLIIPLRETGSGPPINIIMFIMANIIIGGLARLL